MKKETELGAGGPSFASTLWTRVLEAKDLTQGFFTAFLERDFLRYVERGRGKFRTFLLTAFEHYLAGVRAAGPLVLAGAQAALLWTVYATTLRASARSYFRLVCPSCGRSTRKGADLFFEKAECGACRTVW